MKYCLVVLAVAGLLGSAACFPNFWPTNVDDEAACDDHPEGPFKGHGVTSRDKSIKIILEDLEGEKVKKFCPGMEYEVKVEYGEPRKGMLTSTGGAFELEEDVDELVECETRKNFLGDVADNFANLEEYTALWTAPCKGNKVTFRTTSATDAAGAYLWNSKRMRVDKKCEPSPDC